MDSTEVATKPHAVCIPFPAQSHIKAMLKFAKLLHHRAIPDSLPDSNEDTTQDVTLLCESVRKNFLAPFLTLLAKLNNDAIETSSNPPVTCIVSDGFLTTFTITAAEEIGAPIVLFYTVAACSFMGCKQFCAVVEKGLAPLKDESCLTNGYLDTVIDWIPGMRDIRLRDLPTFVKTTNPDDIVFNFIMEATDRAHEASAIVIHTFHALKTDVLDALSFMLPHVYSIGPLQLHLNEIPEHHLKMSLTAGVPMLCWPFFADQQMDCRYTCHEWGIGMEISNDVKRDEVEKLVKELMEGAKGKKIKKIRSWSGRNFQKKLQVRLVLHPRT
ncbi:hypothetical protein L3X38_024252 [Prunus dulcis]|uniref:Uncharacterized protein n=1 Tax=Prunus dulcis TaxID=3755 RepID=A0AAD4Z6B4_PRUDU|nr:hypothetical protein L3X38_024252 [Prunus dulcis]